ncbi:MAG: hydroxymethylbilane synthase [Pseudomonadota bacterium]|nr:hydroxymethylbilane synthase [Pseudomonadota bacterium]
MTAPLLRIGVRGSPLALAQAREARDRLAAASPELAAPGAIEIIPIRTTGDLTQQLPKDQPLTTMGGKGLFTKEIEEALLRGEVDVGVHSTKDMVTHLPDGLLLGGLLPREDPRDAFFSRSGLKLDDLPAGSVVGTAGIRRQALVLARRPDLKVVPLRGNVETRLRKMEEGQVHATLLALAGLKRLGLESRATEILGIDVMLPAVAQGAIGLETRAGDERINRWVSAASCVVTTAEVTAERTMLAVLDGSCRAPIAGLARLNGTRQMRLEGLVARPDGSQVIRMDISGAAADAAALGEELGWRLKEKMPPGFFGTGNT